MRILTTSLLAALVLPTAADVITLNDGTVLDAVIVSKTLEVYELEVNVTKSIKEPRTIQRSDVKSVETVNVATTMFDEKIKNLVPVAPFSEASVYEERLKTVSEFLTEHKITTAGTKALAIQSELKEEHAFIATGGVKTSFEKESLITKEDYIKNTLAIDAQATAHAFNTAMESRAFLIALRKYDELEQKHFGTKAHRDTLPKMKKLTKGYAQLLDRELSKLEANKEKKMMAMERLSESAMKRVEKASMTRSENFKKTWEKEQQEGLVWLAIDTQDPQSIGQTIDSLLAEENRLPTIEAELAKIADTGELFSNGWTLAGEGEDKVDELEAILAQLEEAKVDQPYIQSLIDRYNATIPAAEPSKEEMTK